MGLMSAIKFTWVYLYLLAVLNYSFFLMDCAFISFMITIIDYKLSNSPCALSSLPFIS